MKHFTFLSRLSVLLGLLVVLASCPNCAHKGITTPTSKPQGMMYFSYFDTVSYIYSYRGDSSDEFNARCEGVSSILGEYHRLFDIYNEYDGVNNLKTINLNAGKNPVKVDQKLIDFLLYAKELYNTTNGEMNVMMGSVLKLWHNCREQASNSPADAHIPEREELEAAELHTSIDSLIIDEESQTVFINDPEASIDVGALGKGYATEKAAEHLYKVGADGYVLNIGGNIRIVGYKPDGSGWGTGIKNPQNPEAYALVLTLADTSCVTSGDYERFFTVDGTKYHHIIDKDTLMPSTYFSSVSVITPNSALADALSTALFTMSYENGLELVSKLDNVNVLWITKDGAQYYTEGLSSLIRN